MNLDSFKEIVSTSSKPDQRRIFFAAYVAVSIALLTGFWLLFLTTSLTQNLFLVSLFATSLLVSVLYFAGSDGFQFSRLISPIIGLVNLPCLLYFLYLAKGDGASAMWMLLLPPSTIFMIGLSAGTLYSALGLIGSLFIMTSATLEPYSTGFITRFGACYTLLTAICFGFEYWRVSLDVEKTRLDKELEQTRNILSGFIKVCAWCQNIEKSDNSWHSLEDYISENQGKHVSHAMCPKCESESLE